MILTVSKNMSLSIGTLETKSNNASGKASIDTSNTPIAPTMPLFTALIPGNLLIQLLHNNYILY